ncbi:MAG: hypothetical protein ACN2B6_01435, partial [Rickettsiales bacterium]
YLLLRQAAYYYLNTWIDSFRYSYKLWKDQSYLKRSIKAFLFGATIGAATVHIFAMWYVYG